MSPISPGSLRPDSQTVGDFTHQANAYARARPGYPVTLVDALLASAEVQAGDAVADIGAGTGILTRLLAQRGLRITAVEPNAAMRALAPPACDVTWTAGTFEHTGLADGSQKWAVAAQAFHWAQPTKALPELRRSLQSGGHLTVLWNNRDNLSDPIVHWTRDSINRHVPEFTHAYRDRDWGAVLLSTGDFADVQCHEARHVVPMTVARYLDLWRSHNRLNTIAGPQRFDAFLNEIIEHLEHERVQVVEVPYIVRAWTVRRV